MDVKRELYLRVVVPAVMNGAGNLGLNYNVKHIFGVIRLDGERAIAKKKCG